jgi:thymidylate kinase
MIIIVEGVDRVGKSTLCEMLSKELHMKVFHDNYKAPYIKLESSVCKTDEIVNQIIDMKFEQILQWAALCGDVIIDRCHLTEYAYNLQRGYEFGIRDIDKALAKQDIHLVLVLSEDIKESSKQHGSDLAVTEAIMKALFHGSKIPNKYQTRYKDFDSMVQTLKIKYSVEMAKAAI